MKLQNLTIIFCIIVIPVVLILSAYIGTQIDTATLQRNYDTKLLDATHDAVVAFQTNTQNNVYSANADSVRRDIKAAINVFSTSLSTGLGFGAAGTERVLPYIPAMLFTMYDGFYIYTPDYDYDGEKELFRHILKPYINYTARYVSGDSDIVVAYSLDNYISVYGNVAGKGYVARSGYLIDLSRVKLESGKVVAYQAEDGRWFNTTDTENLYEQQEDGRMGVAYNNESAKKYYQEAYEFTKWLIQDMRIQNIVIPQNAKRADGKYYKDVYVKEYDANQDKVLILNSNNKEEDLNSAFNQHKRDIMKLAIQDNLNTAIARYDKNSQALGTTASFSLPKLTDEDWEKILTGVNMITFMQGLQVGTKVYNSYAIVTSTNNKQYISPNEIYYIDTANTYHRINCDHIQGNITGYKASDFKRIRGKADESKFYYKHQELACYYCIVSSLNKEIDISELNSERLQKYYYALAREKYNLYKATSFNYF